MDTFSKRQGIKQDFGLDPKLMPDEVRNRIWNVVQEYIDEEFDGINNRDAVIVYIWDRFFKENKNNLRRWDSYS